MKTSELREKSIADLKNQLIDSLKEQFDLRMRAGANQQAPKTHLHKKVRSNIARIKTILKEKGSKS